MPSDRLTQIRSRIESLNNWLSNNQPFSSISQDGMSISVDRMKVMEELDKLQSEEKRLAGKRRWIRKIDMTGSD
jgi:hypothetical protein